MQDSDDLSVPERLSIEVQYLQKHPDIGLVSGLAACIDDDGNVFDYLNLSSHVETTTSPLTAGWFLPGGNRASETDVLNQVD